jgi:hypothetical protein
MPMKRVMIVAALLILFACRKHDPIVSTDSPRGDATLFSSVSTGERPARPNLYVLYVPEFELPKTQVRLQSGGSGGTPERWTLEREYNVGDTKITADELTVAGRELQDARGGRTTSIAATFSWPTSPGPAQSASRRSRMW